MPNIFHNQDLRCLIVAPSQTIRQLFSAVLKDLGYPHVICVTDFKACLEILEAEEVGWVIGPLFDQAGASLLQILELIREQAVLRGIKVSALRDGNDKLLPQAFAQGLLSWHRLPSTRDALRDELSGLLMQLQSVKGDCTRVAAHYLRRYLLEAGEHRELKNLFEALLQVYPGDDGYMLELAEAHLLAGDEKSGKTLLHQVQITAPARYEQVRELSQKYFGSPTLPGDAQGLLAEHFGFHSCLVVDPQSTSAQRMHDILRRLGFKQVTCFADPLAALKWLRHNPKPNLIISHWQLPTLPGPVFLYKVRHRLGNDTPLMILHRNIAEREAPMLIELGASRLVQEPVSETDLFDDIIWTLKECTHPREVGTVRQKLLVASKRRDVAEIRRLREVYAQLPTLLPCELLLVDAQIAYDAGCYLHAKKHALDAMLQGADARSCMEVLGRALMALREFEAAIRCLENVSLVCPLNISHLCALAECHLEAGHERDFEQKLEAARDIDPDAPEVLETAAKGAIKRGHTEMAKKLMQQLKSFREVLSFMNNRAVTLMRVGDFEQGLDLYAKTLQSLPSEVVEIRSAVLYNQGLGYARANRLEEALRTLAEAEKTKSLQRQQKARDLRQRIRAAIDTGQPIILKTDNPPSELEEQAKLAQLHAIDQAVRQAKELSRSDYCLLKIYRTELLASEAATTLSKKISFNSRGTLVKDFHKGLILDDVS